MSVEVEALSRKLEPERDQQMPAPGLVRNIHPGDTVRVAKLNKTGTVSAVLRDMLELEIAGKTIRLKTAEVMPAKPAPHAERGASTLGCGTDLHEDEGAQDRLNIIGLRVAEGLAEVDRFIDRAGLNHLSIVTVIHGLGTGALKTAVTDFLKNHPLVASLRIGEPAEGGAGVTVVELKK
jgi:DNA mismatch repair protein MutS2